MTGTGRLLVLDDDPVMREIIGVLAESDGFEVQLTDNADQLLDLVARWHPTHLSLDLVMPQLDGVEVLRQLSEHQCNAGIIIVSGVDAKLLTAAQRMADEHDLQVLGTLSKPFRHDDLRRLLLAERTPRPARAHPRDNQPVIVSPKVISNGIELGQFILHFQPKIRLSDGSWVGVEALSRWQHPLLGTLGPDTYVGAVERIGAVRVFTDAVIEYGLDWASAFRLPRDVTVALNLSADDVCDPLLPSQIQRACASRGLLPAQVQLELTESCAMRDPESSLATLTRLRLMGFGLAIDDFGTGYSSMVQLARLPFSSMKIDRSFVRSIESSSESRKIVHSIIQLGHALGLSVVAEGVETIGAARVLDEMGCDVVQGYLIAPPLSDLDLAHWRQTWSADSFRARVAHPTTTAP